MQPFGVHASGEEGRAEVEGGGRGVTSCWDRVCTRRALGSFGELLSFTLGSFDLFLVSGKLHAPIRGAAVSGEN